MSLPRSPIVYSPSVTPIQLSQTQAAVRGAGSQVQAQMGDLHSAVSGTGFGGASRCTWILRTFDLIGQRQTPRSDRD